MVDYVYATFKNPKKFISKIESKVVALEVDAKNLNYESDDQEIDDYNGDYECSIKNEPPPNDQRKFLLNFFWMNNYIIVEENFD